jgi:frataxin
LESRTTHPDISSRRLSTSLIPSPLTKAAKEDSSANADKTAGTQDWPEHDFLMVANGTLDAIYECALDSLEGSPAFGSDFDAESSAGVVRLSLGGDHGTYVANTQTPNRQIWLSSPVSGPWRYDWDREGTCWRSTRDGHKLVQLLQRELGAKAGVDLVITDPNSRNSVN